jgi:NADH-quinone oxidoreductase subunit N
VVFPDTLMVDGQSLQTFWVNLVVVLSAISMTFGNVLALRQSNIKRLLAYSSIAQAGYTLIGLAAIGAKTDLAVASVAFYMFMYTFTNLLAFAVVVLVGEATKSEAIKDIAGLNRRSPWLALAMTVALLSLGGIPPAAGFFGKFFLFQAAVDAGQVGLAIIGVLNAIVALYYYLVLIKVMYVDPHPDEDKAIGISRPYAWVLGVSGLVIILLGTVAATPVFNWAMESAGDILSRAM